ncbi:MAG: TM0106 family RecB-like putative nuclease [Acidobacteriota bacterium]
MSPTTMAEAPCLQVMRFIGPTLVLATTDLTKFVQCEHATFLDQGTKSGTITPLAYRPPSRMSELIARKGDEHEHAYVEQLRAEGKRVVTIEKAPWGLDALHRAEAETLEAMRSGADYVYQAAFFDGRWSGYADLLERVDQPSPLLGPHRYEVVDTKLARSVRAHFLLQLSDYSHHLARLQGCVPDSMHVVLGTKQRVSFPVHDFVAYSRHVRASLDRFVVRGHGSPPYPVEFCALCTWWAHCSKHWNDIDHLSLVANIRRTQVNRLERGDVRTLTELAEASATVRKIPEETFDALHHQARLQLQQRQTGQHTFELLPREQGRGFFRLPRPSSGDVFLDVEGDPFAGEGLTYLFGAAWEESGATEYRAWWAHDAAEERAEFESVMDFLVARRHANADAHVYHYGAMDRSTLERLAGRHATREKELDDLLRRQAFVDLSAIVRQSMRISHSSYGLKKVETFYFHREAEGVADAGGAILAYEQWLETNDGEMLGEIQRYNREDCLSIVGMRRWLAGIRPDDVAWKEPPEPQTLSDDRIEEDQKNDVLYKQLQQGQPLLAHLLYYHRREERPAWWRWFDRREKMTDEELLDDSEPIGGLRLDESVPPMIEKKSVIFTYRFPPQEHKLDPGDGVHDRVNRAGEIVSIDDGLGLLQLKRGPSLQTLPHPDALIARPSVDSGPIRTALRRFAESVASAGDQTSYRAAMDILLARAPRVSGEQGLREVADVAQRLDQSYLFVQGPPGSGKTFNGAHAIVELLRAGRRVGVTSSSHAAIHNLLHAVEDVARQEDYWFRGLKKGNDERTRYASSLPNPMIESTGETSDCADPAIRLVAGTAWLFSDASMDQSLDCLFIDEAGQVSLANALAVSTAARNVVLLGDPLQLAQVSQGSHPDGTGLSVLDHLLGQHATVPPDRGIFLEHTRRLHPGVCAFVSEVVYESRLRSHASCANQAVTVDGVRETGLRFIAIEHEGNSQSSDEEAERIATEIARMVRGTFTNSAGVTTPLSSSSFLVVAAYNAQVRHLNRALHAHRLHDVPVGTVDKFQGREAPVVFFSMATSSGTELPRDIDFLFSRNRLNVAISRARCLAIVVASPRLLDVHCKTPKQMKLVNGLCRFVEMASPM